jgi:hypothetical protein
MWAQYGSQARTPPENVRYKTTSFLIRRAISTFPRSISLLARSANQPLESDGTARPWSFDGIAFISTNLWKKG